MADRRFETLKYEVDEGVATITLNRPEKLNAFKVTWRLFFNSLKCVVTNRNWKIQFTCQ